MQISGDYSVQGTQTFSDIIYRNSQTVTVKCVVDQEKADTILISRVC